MQEIKKQQYSSKAEPSVRLKFKKPVSGREIALQALLQVWQDGAYAALALHKLFRSVQPEERERRFATELVNGAVKARGTLDFLLRQLIDRPLYKLEPVVLHILHLGLYQIFFLDRIPDSAACNESVNLAKYFSHKGTDKFINGVLRNSIRRKETLWQKVQADTALKTCHPRWLVDRWEKQFGSREAEALCIWNNTPPPVCVRINTMVTTRDQFLQDLREINGEAEMSLWSPEGLILGQEPGLSRLLQLFPHSFYVQDESSMLPARALAPQPGERVLDLCAAPGGKATHLAALMQGKGQVTACDIYPHKLKLIEENARRLELPTIQTELQDGTVFRPDWSERFDRVLVDAPCSGLGVMRRRAEARWTKKPQGLDEFPPLQKAILRNAARYVRPGGYLLYSTCTLETAENQAQIEAFLAEFPAWERAEFSHPRTGSRVSELQLYPQRDGTDGFYLALLHRSQTEKEKAEKA